MQYCCCQWRQGSCGEKWLAVQSHDKIYIDEYYNSESRIYEALIAAYDPLQWFDWGLNMYNPVPLIYEVMADDIYPGGANESDNRHLHLMFNYSADPTNVPTSIWGICYSGINRANCVAKYMPGVENISDAKKAEFLAEAAVLRTWYYTQDFGNSGAMYRIMRLTLKTLIFATSQMRTMYMLPWSLPLRRQ